MARETFTQNLDDVTDVPGLLRAIYRQNKAILKGLDNLSKEHKTMSDAFDSLDARVEQDIQDDSAAKQAYADLKAAFDAEHQTAVAAVEQSNLDKAAKEQALADLDAARQRAQAAADKLAGSSPITPTDPPA